MRKITINGLELDIDIQRKRGNRRIIIRVKNNVICVSAPYLIKDKDIYDIVHKHEDYILNNIETDQNILNSCHLFGKSYKVEEVLSTKNQVILLDDIMVIYYTKDPKKVLYDFYKQELEKYIESIYDRVLNEFNIKHKPELYFRYLISRYGSYTRTKHLITLSTLLAKYDSDLIDSVLYHEVSHIYYFDHSRKFYDLLISKYPNYKEINKKLKTTKYHDKY